MIAVLFEDRLQQVKVNGAHLGGEDGVAGLVHFLGEFRPVIGGGLGLGANAPRLTLVHGGQQTADADTGSAQIVHLVDFQDGVEFVAPFQNFAHLIGGNGVQAAAEGIQLNQLQVLPIPHKFRRTVQPGMVDPLVVDPEGAFGGEIDGQTVLGEDGEIVGGNHFWDTVVDFGVNVIGPASQNNAPRVIFRHPLQRLLPLCTNVGLGALLFFPCLADGSADFLPIDAPFFLTQSGQPVGGDLLAGKGEEGTDVADFAVGHGFHVVFQILRVGDHDGAVVMILRAGGLLMLIEYAGMENGFDSLIDEPLDVTVGELGGVALGFRGDGLHAQLVDFPVGFGGENHPKAQFPEECCPEGVVFVHIQHSGNADDAPAGIFQRGIVEHPLQLICHHVGAFPPGSRAAQTLFASVAGDMAASAGEFVDGQHTPVGAAAAAGGGGGAGQIQNVVQGKGGAFLTVIAFPRHQRRAKGTHDAGNIGAGGLHAGNLLKGAKHRLIVERAALHHDVSAKVGGVGQLDDLVKGVFDDGVGKSRGNILHRRALFLRLLDVGIHEHGAAGAKVDGIFGEQCLFGKPFCAVAKGIGEVFDEGAAPGGAGFVQQNSVHAAVFQLDALHVLPADIQHAVHLRVKKRGGGAVGDGFHLALVQTESRFQEGFSVACGAGAGDVRALGQLVPETRHGIHGGADGVTLIVGVIGKEKLTVAADERHLRGGGTGVNAQEALPPVIGQAFPADDGFAVAGAEGLMVFPRGEQGVETF